MASSASDPFYVARDKLDGDVKQARLQFDRWHTLLETSNTADVSFQVAHEECGRDLSKLLETIRKVKASVAAVEKNRIRFPHIDDRELASRKAFLGNLESVVSGMFAVYNGPETKGRIDADRKRELNTRQSQEVAVAAQRQNAYTAANSSFIGDQQQQQQAIRQQQDQSLDKMGNALDTLDAMAREIKVELDAQNVMLEDVDREIDTAQTKMDHAMKGIQKLLNTKSNCQIAIIAILVVIFVIVAAIAFS